MQPACFDFSMCSLVKLVTTMSFEAKIKQWTIKLVIALTLVFSLAGWLGLAAQAGALPFPQTFAATTCDPETQDEVKNDKGEVVSCKPSADCEGEDLNAGNCRIVHWVVVFINVLSAMVGITVVIMVIIGGIQYSASGDDPQKVQEAKKKISNALLALVAFIFMYAFLQWVVPGGLF